MKIKILSLVSFLLWFLTGAALAQDDKKAESPKLAHIAVSGLLKEGVQRQEPGFLFRPKKMQTLYSLIRRIDDAAADKKVKAMILEIDSPVIGMAKIEEIRRALLRFKESGKKIHIHMEAASMKELVLASATNDISMMPSGILVIPGLRAELLYMKDLLDWAGLKADVVHIGEFKTAFENLYRKDMSEGQKKSLGAVIDGFYELILNSIAAGRGISKDRIESAIDVGMLTPDQAKARGLIDNVEYADQFRERLKAEYGEKMEVLKNYGEGEREEIEFDDFSAVFSMFSQMFKKAEKPKGEKIAVIYAVGTIVSGKSEESGFGGQTMGSETMVEAIRDAAGDDQVKAIVLRVDSPGGSGMASDAIWRELILAKKKKPLIVSMSDVAGSGGYYIAMPADAIVAESGTITGSIGVIGMKMVLGDLYKKIGLNAQYIQKGKRAGMFTSSTPFNEDEREFLTRVLENFYQEFVTKASQGRGMDYEKLEALARGRIYTGEQAKSLGLVDELGGLDTALRLAKSKAGLDATVDLAIWELPRPKTFAEMLEEGMLFQMQAQALQAGFGEALEASPVLQETLSLVQNLMELQDNRLFLMPVHVQWR